jgi:hypothetical protein
MNTQKITNNPPRINKELPEVAGLLAIFQRLPQAERIAYQYYIKGRVDAASGNIEMPALTFSHEKSQARFSNPPPQTQPKGGKRIG